MIMGGAAAGLIYISKGHFYYPFHQIVRAIVFGSIAGSATTLAVILFKIIGVLKVKKTR